MIEYCLCNVDDATRRRLTDAGATEAPCLEHCGICYVEPFLVVDGDLRRGEHEAVLADDADESEPVRSGGDAE